MHLLASVSPSARGSPAFRFGTKAETLARLRPLLRSAHVPEGCYFEVQQWRREPSKVLAWLQEHLGSLPLAVRSSAQNEDAQQTSMAGHFTTCLDVDGADPTALAQAIDRVVASYGEQGQADDQVLVQPMLTEIAVSGVVTTRVLSDGAPYYAFDYDDSSGRTDSITGGTGVSKTVLVYRPSGTSYVESPRLAQWLSAVRDVERLCGGTPLDIEFAQTPDHQLHVLQVRPIAAERTWNRHAAETVAREYHHVRRFVIERGRPRGTLVGRRTILGNMPDWNPAEIIGPNPKPLAASLYRHLVTDSVWRRARARLGYRHPQAETLMVVIGGRPYIDVRNSFNSFLPAALDDETAEVVVDAWLDRLEEAPELHDKIEFDVAQTVMDLDFWERLEERYPGLLDGPRADRFARALRDLTRRQLDNTHDGPLGRALRQIRKLEKLQRGFDPVHRDPPATATELLAAAERLLNDCKHLGTMPFAMIARHAFVAEAILRSAVRRGAVAPSRISELKRSLATVTRTMTRDFAKVHAGRQPQSSFLERYGHLRAGTYDLLSPRYDQRPTLFDDCRLPEVEPGEAPFSWQPDEARALDQLLGEAGLDHISAGGLLHYTQTAVAGREYAKFAFSKNLSDALELLARWGERHGFSREDLTYLPVHAMLETLHSQSLADPIARLREGVAQGRERTAVSSVLRLGYLIRSVRDLYVVPIHRSSPNFITQARVEGEGLRIDNCTAERRLDGRIALIESGDPGFDWIFTRGVAGLVTKFGGSNSHMAIRCAEFGLPAAIGCGEHLFERLERAGGIELDCGEQIVRPAHG